MVGHGGRDAARAMAQKQATRYPFQSMKSPKTKRGGARPGAGRPALPESERSVTVTVRLRPAVAARFVAWCKAKGKTQSGALTAWIARLRTP